MKFSHTKYIREYQWSPEYGVHIPVLFSWLGTFDVDSYAMNKYKYFIHRYFYGPSSQIESLTISTIYIQSLGTLLFAFQKVKTEWSRDKTFFFLFLGSYKSFK
jgi:hypothetical protein